MKRTLLAYRISLGLFIAGLVLSGLTAFPLLHELSLLCRWHTRHILLEWRVLDCSFGIVGAIPLLYCLHLTKKLSRET